MVDGHGVLSNHALPVLVGEQRYMLAIGQRLAVKPSAESFHTASLPESDGRLDALSKHSHVFRMGEVVVVHQRIVQRVLRPELDHAARLRPEHHGEHAEHIAIVDLPEHFVIELVRQPVGVLHVGAPVGISGGRG